MLHHQWLIAPSLPTFNTLAATPPHGRDTLTVHRQPHGVDKFFKWDFCQSYCRSCHAQGRRQKYGHSLTFWRIVASNSFGQGTISTINCLGRFRVFPCDACWYWFLKSNLFRNCCNYSKCFTLDPTDAPLQEEVLRKRVKWPRKRISKYYENA